MALPQVKVTSDLASEMTVGQLSIRFGQWAEENHPPSKIYTVRATVSLLNDMYAELPVSQFKSSCLIRLQELMIEAGRTRKYINEIAGLVKRIFRWSVRREYVTSAQYTDLATVENVSSHQVRESGVVECVDDQLVDQTLPFMSATVADMVRFQRLTSCRPCEVRIIRPMDVDRSQDIWVYRPNTHKTQHRGKVRAIPIGPKAQQIIQPRLLRPRRCVLLFPSDKAGYRCYTKDTYARAIARACRRGNLDHWYPNQLRHTAATEIRKLFGLEAAQVSLGHSHAAVTQIYGRP